MKEQKFSCQSIYLLEIRNKLLFIGDAGEMDTLASLIASNYALYSSGQIRPGMYFNPFSYHPQNATCVSSANMSPIPQLPALGQSTKTTETSSDRNVSTNCTNDKVKFSIDSILARKSKTDENDTEETKAEDMWLHEDESSMNPEEDQTDLQKYSWLQCTRYKPPKLPRLKKKDGVKKRKLGRNPRVPFTQHQVAVLEQKFRRTHYLSSMDVVELSTALNLTETRVKIWFQNRRARERRDREAIQRGQVIQTRNVPSGAVSGVSWTFPSPHTAFMNLRDTLQLTTSFPPVSLSK